MATSAPPKPAADSAPNDAGWKPELHEIPIAAIDVGDNVRSADALDVQELASSIRVHGVISPVRVADAGSGRYTLVYGQRRVAASIVAGRTTIPAIVDGEALNAQARTVEQLIENLQRADLNAVDTAKAYRALLDAGLTQRELGEQLGIAQPTIANTLRLLKAPVAIQERVAAGDLTRSHAEAIAKLPAAEQTEVARRIVEHDLSVEGVRGEIESAARRAAEEERRAEDRKKRESGRLARAVELLLTKKLDSTVVTLVTPFAGTVADLLAVLAKSGWKTEVGGSVVKPMKGCDCTAWQFGIRYEYSSGKESEKLSLTRACISSKHQAAASKAERDAWETQQREQREAAAKAAEVRAAQLAPAISAVTTAIPPAKAKLILMALISGDTNSWWTASPWLERVTGKAASYDGWRLAVWKAIDGLEHERLLVEVARIVAERILDGGPDPAREALTSLYNAGERVAAKKAKA